MLSRSFNIYRQPLSRMHSCLGATEPAALPAASGISWNYQCHITANNHSRCTSSSTHEHGAGSVEDITCSELFFARLQEVSSLHRLADWRNTLEYRENSPDGDIDVDVRRA